MANKQTKDITLHLQLDEVNTLLEALGHMPFMRVYRIIEKIHVQASAPENVSLKEMQAPPAAKKTPARPAAKKTKR